MFDAQTHQIVERPDGPSGLVLDMLPQASGSSLSEAMKRALPEHSIVKVDPVTDLVRHGSYVSLDDLVKLYAERVERQPTKPGVVIAHCQAATFGMALTARLRDGGSSAALALLDPVWQHRIRVSDELSALRATMGVSALDGQGLDSATDPVEVLRQVREVIEHDLTSVAEARRLRPAAARVLRDQLGGRYMGWMSYIISAATFRGKLAPADLTIVLTDADLAGVTAGHGQAHVVPASRDEFLSHPETLTVLSAFVARAGHRPTVSRE
jgi:hypothetical protein